MSGKLTQLVFPTELDFLEQESSFQALIQAVRDPRCRVTIEFDGPSTDLEVVLQKHLDCVKKGRTFLALLSARATCAERVEAPPACADCHHPSCGNIWPVCWFRTLSKQVYRRSWLCV